MAENSRVKYDIILAGVGGQGVLSLAAVIALGAQKAGLKVRQSEVHGMAQRGGAVLAHLRLSDSEIAGDLIPLGRASMILSMEPLEALRYLRYLGEGGIVVTSSDPVVNIRNYPEKNEIISEIEKLPESLIVHSTKRAKEAGSVKATNMVMVGAAADFLPLSPAVLEEAIRDIFRSKGEDVTDINIKAFRIGQSNTGENS